MPTTTYKIVNNSDLPTLWLVSYNASTGLVNEVTTSEALGTDYGSAIARDAVIELINSNSNNTFIGHIPRHRS